MFQEATASQRPTVASTALERGMMIWKKMRSGPAPSMKAASSSSEGMAPKKFFTIMVL